MDMQSRIDTSRGIQFVDLSSLIHNEEKRDTIQIYRRNVGKTGTLIALCKYSVSFLRKCALRSIGA